MVPALWVVYAVPPTIELTRGSISAAFLCFSISDMFDPLIQKWRGTKSGATITPLLPA
jgi:hypothetical protein